MATQIISGEGLGIRICNAIGISTKHLVSVHIAIEPQDVVRIDAKYFMDEDQADGLIGILSKNNSNATDEN